MKFSIPDELRLKLREAAEREERSESFIVRRAIREYLTKPSRAETANAS